MKTIITLLFPIVLFSQGTTHVNFNASPNLETLQAGLEHFFLEDMSFEASYITNTGLATLNYTLWANEDFSVQAKWGMNLYKNVTGGFSAYYQVHPYLHIGVTGYRMFKEESRNIFMVGFSIDISQLP
jgi:hypothetical protein